MDVDVSASATIDRPVADVAAFVGDPTNAPRWYANIRSVEWATPPPVGVGSRLDFVATFLGRTLRYTYEVVELVVGERLVMRTAQGPFPMETTYAWRERGPRRTEMTMRNRGAPRGFAGIAAPALAAAMRRAMRKDLRALARVLEEG